jgi:hypothetical protein
MASVTCDVESRQRKEIAEALVVGTRQNVLEVDGHDPCGIPIWARDATIEAWNYVSEKISGIDPAERLERGQHDLGDVASVFLPW